MTSKWFTITVTVDDINSGCRANASACPIARAARRALRRRTLEVTKRAILLRVGTVSLPSSAQTFVRNFDAGKQVRPFSFDVVVAT